MQKKGAATLLGFLIGIIIGAIILVVITKLTFDISDLLVKEKNDGIYFDELIRAIEKSSAGGQEIIYYVSKKHFLAGFGKNDNEIIAKKFTIKKPVEMCGKESCICKCNVKNDFIEDDSCYFGVCEILNGIESIEGLILLDEDIGDAEKGSLLIKGKNEMPLKIKRDGAKLIISVPRQN